MKLIYIVLSVKEGKIQQIDTPTNIYNTPANLFVAEFIGSPRINVIRKKELYEWLINTNSYNTKNIYAVRPEDIKIEKTNNNSLGKIVLREILGKEVRYHVQLKKEKIIVCDIINNNNLLNENDYVKCSIKNDKLYIFNKKTEERVIM